MTLSLERQITLSWPDGNRTCSWSSLAPSYAWFTLSSASRHIHFTQRRHTVPNNRLVILPNQPIVEAKTIVSFNGAPTEVEDSKASP